MKQVKPLSPDDGEFTSEIWQCDEIKIGYGISRWKNYGTFSSGNTNDVVRMHFGMRGDYSFYYKQLDKKFDLLGGHHNIMYSNGFDMVIENKTLEIETFGVQFPKEQFISFTQNASDQLMRFTEHIVAGKSVILSDQWGSIDTAIDDVIRQIVNCKYSGDLKKLFLLSKSIELLVLSAESCNKAASKKTGIIKNRTDQEKIIAVRDLINNRVTSPPNLSEIAKTVGLNEYKLKRGFKETFNKTVFGYLTDQRLNLAQQYLRDTQMTAAELSQQLGYATPQHFNNAFKKKFGITPFLVRKTPD